MKLILHPSVIYEVGVGGVNVSRAARYFGNPDVEVHLFDPITEHMDQFRNYIKRFNIKNTHIHECCIGDKDGKVDIYECFEHSMILGLEGPNINKKQSPETYFGEKPVKIVSKDCFRISEFDKGNIDVILIDIEGGEWFVLKHLVSRPSMIWIELCENYGGGDFTNEHTDKILQWMDINGYQAIQKLDLDVLFVKKQLMNLLSSTDGLVLGYRHF